MMWLFKSVRITTFRYHHQRCQVSVFVLIATSCHASLFFHETELVVDDKHRWGLMGGFPASLWITRLKRATHRINVGWPDDSWYSSLPWIHVTAARCRVVFQRNLIILSLLQTSEERIWFISASEDLAPRATKCSPVKRKNNNIEIRHAVVEPRRLYNLNEGDFTKCLHKPVRQIKIQPPVL